MKNFLILLPILSSFSFALAYTDCRDTDRGCDLAQWAQLCMNAPISSQEKIETCKWVIKTANQQITDLQKQNTSVSVNNNQNTQVVFSNGSGIVQKTDPSSGINYNLYPTITGNAPLTLKFTAGGGQTIGYGDGTDSASLKEGSRDAETGYRLEQGQVTTHTYTKPGTYTANLFGLTPSGKRAEVQIIVTGNNSQNTSCQKLTQTLWEGNINQSAIDVELLQKFLSKLYSAEQGGSISGAIYGRDTINFVKIFQSRNGIKQTGAVGPVTLAKINSMICGNSNLYEKYK